MNCDVDDEIISDADEINSDADGEIISDANDGKQ